MFNGCLVCALSAPRFDSFRQRFLSPRRDRSYLLLPAAATDVSLLLEEPADLDAEVIEQVGDAQLVFGTEQTRRPIRSVTQRARRNGAAQSFAISKNSRLIELIGLGRLAIWRNLKRLWKMANLSVQFY